MVVDTTWSVRINVQNVRIYGRICKRNALYTKTRRSNERLIQCDRKFRGEQVCWWIRGSDGSIPALDSRVYPRSPRRIASSGQDERARLRHGSVGCRHFYTQRATKCSHADPTSTARDLRMSSSNSADDSCPREYFSNTHVLLALVASICASLATVAHTLIRRTTASSSRVSECSDEERAASEGNASPAVSSTSPRRSLRLQLRSPLITVGERWDRTPPPPALTPNASHVLASSTASHF